MSSGEPRSSSPARAKLDRRTKHLVQRPRPRATSRSSTTPTSTASPPRSSSRPASASSSTSRRRTSGRFPNPGPLLLVRGGVCLIDAPGAALFDEVTDGEVLTVRGASVFRNGTCLARGRGADERRAGARRSPSSSSRVTEALEAFAENTLQHLRDEGACSPRGSSSRRSRRASATGTRSSSPAARLQARPPHRPPVHPRLQARARRASTAAPTRCSRRATSPT